MDQIKSFRICLRPKTMMMFNKYFFIAFVISFTSHKYLNKKAFPKE